MNREKIYGVLYKVFEAGSKVFDFISLLIGAVIMFIIIPFGLIAFLSLIFGVSLSYWVACPVSVLLFFLFSIEGCPD